MVQFGINRRRRAIFDEAKMRRKFIVLLAAGAGLAATAASASDDPSGTPADSRRICRDSGRQLGSHVRTARRCRTAEQWRQEDEERARATAGLRVTEGQNDGQPGHQPQ
jgi:hypothetical protein